MNNNRNARVVKTGIRPKFVTCEVGKETIRGSPVFPFFARATYNFHVQTPSPSGDANGELSCERKCLDGGVYEHRDGG